MAGRCSRARTVRRTDAPPARVFFVHGLGALTHDAATIAFDFSRQGKERRLVVTKEDGTPLIDSVLQDDGSHVTKVLDGALIVRATAGDLKWPRMTNV